VRESWSITAQLTLVVPLVYLVGVAAGHEGHAAWATQRIRAVSVRKPDALIGQPIQMRSLHNGVRLTSASSSWVKRLLDTARTTKTNPALTDFMILSSGCVVFHISITPNVRNHRAGTSDCRLSKHLASRLRCIALLSSNFPVGTMCCYFHGPSFLTRKKVPPSYRKRPPAPPNHMRPTESSKMHMIPGESIPLFLPNFVKVRPS